MNTKHIISAAFLLLFSAQSFSQKWVEEMQKADGNLYEIQSEFNSYWSTRNTDEKGKGYKVFKRWEQFVAPRVYPSGDLSQLNQTAKNFDAFLKTQAIKGPGKSLGGSALIASATFTPMGPFGALSGVANNGLSRKSGRLNFITFDPTNPNNLWVGAPAGGLWSSTNNGTSWSTATDQLSVIGCSDLAIDPTNTSIMYLATGDGDAGDTKSIGVLKSTNGGATWNPTGLISPVSSSLLIRRLIINPSNTQILLAATNVGIYRTTDGGVTWNVVSTANTFDLEFKPGDPTVVYAGGTSFRLSTNSGSSFTQITNGISASFQRIAIAVTPADADYVYVLASDPSTSGFAGLFRSTNSGSAFNVMSTSATINVLGNNSNGQDVGGQGWYDLCLAASPLNRDEIVTGGVNAWKSLDGGSSWSINGHWTASGAPYLHSDQHDLEYNVNGVLYSCNDGTVYYRTPSTWVEICGLMNISQIYKIGLSGVTANRWITGHQDNGTNIFTGTSYQAKIAGDGMDCFYDRTNDQNVFGESQNGGMRRSVDGGNTWITCTSGLTGTAPWVTVWKQDPQISSTIYCGLNQMFRSTNLAVSGWSQLAAMPSSAPVIEFAIAPSNNQVIYVLKGAGIYKTVNGGTSWTTVTNGVPVGSAAPTFITIHPTDPNTAWVTLSGYSAGNKVYMTTNGGTSWTNYSANLPNLPANCSVYQPASNDIVYVGMDVGIYYRANGATQWTLYNAGLPNVPVSDLEISAASPTFLHASTYGRGVWVANVYQVSAPPVSTFNSPANGLCVAASITFTDMSTNSPSTWQWSVLPGAGVAINSATSQNPNITFPSAGIYTITLQANNSFGSGNVYTQTISISTPPPIVVTALTPTQVCRNLPVVFSASGANSYNWSGGAGTAATATFFPIGNMTYTLSGSSNSCAATQTVAAFGMPLPIVSVSGPGTICEGESATLTGSGATTYNWSNGSSSAVNTVSVTSSTNFSVQGTDANGCSAIAFYNLVVDVCASLDKNTSISTDLSVFPNPTKDKLTIKSSLTSNEQLKAEVYDVSGKLVVSKQVDLINHQAEMDLSTLTAGTYFVKIARNGKPVETIRIMKH